MSDNVLATQEEIIELLKRDLEELVNENRLLRMSLNDFAEKEAQIFDIITNGNYQELGLDSLANTEMFEELEVEHDD